MTDVQPSRNAKPGSRGLALVVVLWATALLSVIAASFAFGMHVETRSAANTLDRARARALADAGIRFGIATLVAPDGTNPWPVDGTVREVQLGEGRVHVSIVSENGKIDLNRAPETLIEGLFTSAGEDVDAASLAHAVLDWRDRDHERRPLGAEDADYTAAGHPYGARDRAFFTISELNQVLGMREDVFLRISDAVTIYSRISRIDPASAPREALLAIPGVTTDQVDAFIAARRESEGRPPLELLGAGRRYMARTRPSVFTIQSEAQVPGGAITRRWAVVRVTRNRKRPYLVLDWYNAGVRRPAYETPES